MDRLIEMYRKKLRFTSTAFIKSTMYEINWDARLIGIRGARGVGKTTLLLQHIKRNFPQDERTLYVSLDNIYFSDNRLYDFADRFVKRGGTRLYLDEVHKYPTGGGATTIERSGYLLFAQDKAIIINHIRVGSFYPEYQ